jgi:tetratricopeptide (TPR) repeat protein
MSFLNFLWKLIPIFLVLGVMGWLLFRWLKKSDEPGALLGRLAITFVLALGLIWAAVKANNSPFAQIAVVLVAAVLGLVFMVLWGPSFCGFVAKQFTNLYDGGDEEAEPRPFYSMAEGRRKQGKYEEAMAEVRGQLSRFPTDFTGWMLLADIQAENLNDINAAHETIAAILAQPGHAPQNIAFALNRLADWHLKFLQDPDGARRALEAIIERLPETEQAQFAHQRIAHMTTEEHLAEQHDRPRITLKHYEENVGLRRDFTGLKPPPEDLAAEAGKYVRHLEKFPNDNEAREKLALIYADHYGRLDLAADQLEQIITIAHQPAKHVVHGLNLLADLQVRLTGDIDVARQTLERIVEMFPKTAAAENARHRIAYLKLEMKPHEKSQAIRLGSYEQNLGLKK